MRDYISNFCKISVFIILSILFLKPGSVHANVLSNMSIDYPVNNATMMNGKIDIGGWALNASGISDIEIHINGKIVYMAHSGQQRYDVNSAYPGYPDGELSGYTYTVNGSDLNAGNNLIEVKAMGKDGSIESRSVNVIRKEARIDVDTPSIMDKVTGAVVQVSGWALNETGIKEVRIIVDGEYSGSATIGLEREDVNRAHPGYIGGNQSGFVFELDTKSIAPGIREITAEAVGVDGSFVRNTRKVEVLKKSPMLSIDTPDNESEVSDNQVLVGGWALNASGIKEVSIYINGVFEGIAETGIKRYDVGKAYPGYPGGQDSGFNFTLPSEKLRSGLNEIKISATGNDGTKKESILNLLIKESITYLDYPINMSITKEKFFSVRGWAINRTGVKEVKVLIDGADFGNATLGLKREDVNKAYPGYPGGSESGFEMEISTKLIPAGIHLIEVLAIGTDDSHIRDSRYIEILKPDPIMSIDYPTNNATMMNGKIDIGGWALNASGISDIEIHINGKNAYIAHSGQLRNDVNSAYPGYPDGKLSGYTYTVNGADLNEGINLIEVKAMGKDGSTESRSVNVIRKDARIDVDTPSIMDKVTGGVVQVGGWALNETGIQEVRILVDGEYAGSATIGLERNDVNSAYPGYIGGKQSGFVFELDTKFIAPGIREITAEAVGVDGSFVRNTRKVEVLKKSPMLSIDTPYNKSEVSDNQVLVGGWALNASGIKEVSIYINGVFEGIAETGIKRYDVSNAYPEYPGAQDSGFNFTLPSEKLRSGLNEIKISATGNDGTKKESILTFTTPAYQITRTQYDYTLESAINSQMKISPQSDKYRNDPAYVRAENIINVSGMVVKPEVNLRTSPDSTLNNIIFRTNGITPVEIVEKGIEGSSYQGSTIWHKVNYEGNIVFVHSLLINEYSVVTNITSRDVSVKADVSDNSHTYGVIKAGTPINIILKINDDWLAVQYKDWRLPTTEDLFQEIDTSEYIQNTLINKDLFQFMKLDSIIKIDVEVLNSYLKGKGKLEGQAESFIQASQTHGVNLAYLVAHAVLETGHGRSVLANGTAVEQGRVVYNFYGIAAYDSDATNSGKKYAYQMGWFEPEAAIMGGAKWISDNYVHNATYYQNTIYKMRWNPTVPTRHQYATDIAWPRKISGIVNNLYQLSSYYRVQFDIPLYK